MMLVGKLAGFDVPAEPQAYSRSISTAAATANSLRSTQWSVLDSVAGRTEEGAVASLSHLRDVAPQEEFHAPLSAALGSATTKASSYLASLGGEVPSKVDPVPPPIPPNNDPNTVVLDGLDDLSYLGTDLEGKVRAAMKAEPGKKLHITWWLE